MNETDTFADEDGANDEYFDFEDISGDHKLHSSSKRDMVLYALLVLEVSTLCCRFPDYKQPMCVVINDDGEVVPTEI